MNQTRHSNVHIAKNKIAKNKIAKYNQKTAIAMMIVFLAPVIIAYTLLNTGIYHNFGTSNHGVLLDPPVNITELSWTDQNQTGIPISQLQKNWWLVYHMPTTCEQACEQRLLQLRQSIQTLGPEKNRVKPLIVITHHSDIKALNIWSEQLTHIKKDFLIAQLITPPVTQLELQTTQKNTENFFKGTQLNLTDGGLYIVDPMGFAMLYYSPVTDEADAISQAKSLIKDLKYLLKVSRIG